MISHNYELDKTIPSNIFIYNTKVKMSGFC